MPTDHQHIPFEDSLIKKIPFYKKILTKIALGFVFVLVLYSISFFALNKNFLEKHITQTMGEEVDMAEDTFHHLLADDTKTLSAVLEVIARDPVIQRLYREKDREKLYAYTHLLFEELKNKHGITHWYFILPDGHTFLRVHENEMYGDEIKRSTFLKARDTQKMVSGLELGKTAYALRTVMPYYGNDGELIGYVELGEKIDHILGVLKREMTNEFVLIADKKYLTREDWSSVMKLAGKEDTWDKVGGEHLILDSTTESASSGACFTEDNLEGVEEGEHLFQRIQENGKTYQCGGFSFNDAGGRHSGSVLALLDVSSHFDIFNQAQKMTIAILLTLFVVFVAFSWILARRLVRPINRLARIAEIVASGDFDVRADIKTGDEIELLAHNFNRMADNLMEVRTYPESIIRSMADSLIFSDTEGKIKEVNQAFLDLLGYAKEEILGQPLQKITWTNDDSLLAFLNKVKAEELRGDKMICKVDTAFRTKDGAEIPMNISCSLMKDDKGEVKGMVLVAKDIHIEREAEEKLKLSEQQLRATNQKLESSQGQLHTKLAELEQFNKAVVGRELKMAELKKEIEELKQRLGE